MAAQNESLIPAAIQQSILDTFKVQSGSEAKVVSVTSESAENPNPASDSIDCMSVLGLKGNGYQGSLALGFPKPTFLRLVEKLIGEVITEIDNQNADACSELLNIIYASSRVKINQGGFEFQPAIPTTICGKDLNLALGPTSKILKFRCESDLGPFLVALSLKKTK